MARSVVKRSLLGNFVTSRYGGGSFGDGIGS
jgi:hypothetical protein